MIELKLDELLKSLVNTDLDDKFLFPELRGQLRNVCPAVTKLLLS
jgi:hypothetical protein